VFDQFTGDHFAFAIGVGGDHQFAGFTEQALDGLELAGGFGFDAHFPFFGNDRQVGQHPALVALIVGIGRGGFEQVANAPGNGDSGAHPAAITASAGTEHGSNIFGLGRFFTQKQPHSSTHSSCRAEGAQHGREWLKGNCFYCVFVQLWCGREPTCRSELARELSVVALKKLASKLAPTDKIAPAGVGGGY